MSSIVVHHGPLLLSAKPSQGAGPMRGILRSLPSQPTINSLARTGNRFIPRPDELVSYGGWLCSSRHSHFLVGWGFGGSGARSSPLFFSLTLASFGTSSCGRVTGGVFV